MLFKIAFRNIWRNRGRTIITIASIFFAVLFSSFMVSFGKGTWDGMLNNVVNFYYGYAQIHKDGYWADQSIDKSFKFDSELQQLLTDIPEIQSVTPRLDLRRRFRLDFTDCAGKLMNGSNVATSTITAGSSSNPCGPAWRRWTDLRFGPR